MKQTTSGKAWREAREEGLEITFPSGHVARIRSITPAAFLRLGKMPDAMAKTIEDVLAGRLQANEAGEAQLFKLDTLEDFQEYFSFLEFYARHCFVSPRIVDTPQSDEEITIDDLDQGDMEFLLQIIFLPAAALRAFRDEQARSLGVVQPGKRDVSKSKQHHVSEAVAAD